MRRLVEMLVFRWRAWRWLRLLNKNRAPWEPKNRIDGYFDARATESITFDAEHGVMVWHDARGGARGITFTSGGKDGPPTFR